MKEATISDQDEQQQQLTESDLRGALVRDNQPQSTARQVSTT